MIHLVRCAWKLAEKLDLIEDNTWDLLWVTRNPLFADSEEEKRYVAKAPSRSHRPMDEDVDKVTGDRGMRAQKAYDIVLNGNEIGGGGIRIHNAGCRKRCSRR